MERDGSGRVRASEREARLVEVMAALAAGDPAAVFALREEFGDQLAGALRRVGRDRQVEFGPDEMDDLVIDACLEIRAVAGGWDPAGGAKPWNWARFRLVNLVDRHIGQWTRPLDPALEQGLAERADGPMAAGAERPADDIFEDLTDDRAEDLPMLALLHEAFGVVASATDRAIVLELAVQTSLGDPSPAVTVARAFGIRPDAVRQKHHRIRKRLRALAAADPRFAELADLALVA